MDSEVLLPLSLTEQMNDDASLSAFRAWRANKAEDTLGGALRTNSHYDKQRASFVGRLENVELQRIVDEYKYKNQADTFWKSFVAEKCSWSLVSDHLQQAETEYNQVSIIRRAFRSEATAILSPFVEAVPEDDGLGLLKAGIIVLLKAMKRRSEACKNIFECFRTIPQLVNTAQRTLSRFSKAEDPEIFCCANRLYSAIIDCLPSLIDHVLRHPDQPKIKQYGCMVKSVVVDEVAVVDNLLQPIRVARRALEQREARLSEKRQDKMAAEVGKTHREMYVLRETQHQHQYEAMTSLNAIEYTTGRIYKQNIRNESNWDAIAGAVRDQVAHVNRMHEENAALREKLAQLNILNSVYMITEEKRRKQRFSDEAPRRSHQYIESRASLTPPKTIHNLHQLLQIICYLDESTQHATELYSTLQQYQSFTEKALARAAYLSEKQEFRHWLLAGGSDILLVNGHCSESMNYRMSPLSVFGATLIQGLLNISQTSQDVVLYFFCGRHTDSSGLLFGPQGLMRSLTAQVISELWSRQVRPNLEFLTEWPDLSGHIYPDNIDIRTMCEIFAELLAQLPAGTTIYCVMDGVSQFETVLDGMVEDLRIVVDCLQWCVLDTTTSVFMKLLLSSADASVVVRDVVPHEQQIDLISGDYYSSVPSPRGLITDLSNQLSFSVLGEDGQSEKEHVGTSLGGHSDPW